MEPDALQRAIQLRFEKYNPFRGKRLALLFALDRQLNTLGTMGSSNAAWHTAQAGLFADGFHRAVTNPPPELVARHLPAFQDAHPVLWCATDRPLAAVIEKTEHLSRPDKWSPAFPPNPPSVTVTNPWAGASALSRALKGGAFGTTHLAAAQLNPLRAHASTTAAPPGTNRWEYLSVNLAGAPRELLRLVPEWARVGGQSMAVVILPSRRELVGQGQLTGLDATHPDFTTFLHHHLARELYDGLIVQADFQVPEGLPSHVDFVHGLGRYRLNWAFLDLR